MSNPAVFAPWWEVAAQQFEAPSTATPTGTRFDSPGAIARLVDRRTITTPALDLIDAALVDLLNTPDGRLIITMPPQEGKSTRVSRDFVLWALHRNPDARVVAASYGQKLANRNSRQVRNLIRSYGDRLGIHLASDHGAASEWSIDGRHGGLRAVGRGAGIAGHAADLVVIDDPIKNRAEAASELVRDGCWDWWTDDISTRLSPGAQVALIQTRWHEADLTGKLLDAPDGALWRVINIPAQAETVDDPLGRKPGEYMVSARRRTTAQWDAIKVRSGARTWASLYQGSPAPASGDILKREWWGRYDVPPYLVRDDGVHYIPDTIDAEMIISADLTFKDAVTSDYVVMQVWLRRGPHVWLLDQVRARMGFVETVQRFRALCAKWPQATGKLIEQAANGYAVINSLSRSIPGIIPITPQGSKVARASAISPFVQAKNVLLPSESLAPWIEDLIVEASAFPAGKHDDQVDGLSQAVDFLLVKRIVDTTPTPAEQVAAQWDEEQLDWAM